METAILENSKKENFTEKVPLDGSMDKFIVEIGKMT